MKILTLSLKQISVIKLRITLKDSYELIIIKALRLYLKIILGTNFRSIKSKVVIKKVAIVLSIIFTLITNFRP